MPINAFLLEQLVVRALLEHLALAEHVDDVGFLDRGEAVRDRNRRPALGDPLKRGLDKLFTLCCGVLVGSTTDGLFSGMGYSPESSELVASSSNSTRGLRMSARAMEIRCFCPPLRLTPRLPMLVLYPSGSEMMKSWMLASRQH
jgi:hypothetical protein